MRVIDSHTEGEPTRLIVSGGPDLGSGPLDERRARFAAEFDSLRSFAVNEPRGSDAVVGALLCEPVDPACAAGLIFFNNVGYLGMCGHGTIGAAVTLAHMGRIGPGTHRFETPVGEVTVELLGRNEVEIENVPSWRYRKDVAIAVDGLGTVVGDIAWGGNWFFLVGTPPLPLTMAHIQDLTRAADAIARALETAGITGPDGGKIDHVEFFEPPRDPAADSRNFVLCPGGAYDRSPCGTGTSAKLACLAADGKLGAGETWIQESIVGSRFAAQYRPGPEGRIVPRIRGRAYVVAEATLLRDPEDPFADGMRGDR
ncbi:MAG: proline racemase family protein [Roseomonas sp.]|nr:proline racemase family protein [Roseomonas sp.]